MLTQSQKVLLRKISSRFRDATADLIKEYEKRVDLKEYQDKKQWALDSIAKFKQNVSDLESFENDFLRDDVKDLGGAI